MDGSKSCLGATRADVVMASVLFVSTSRLLGVYLAIVATLSLDFSHSQEHQITFRSGGLLPRSEAISGAERSARSDVT